MNVWYLWFIVIVTWLIYSGLTLVKTYFTYWVVMGNNAKWSWEYNLKLDIYSGNAILMVNRILVKSIIMVIMILLPNYFITDIFKQKIRDFYLGINEKKGKSKRTEFIKTINQINLVISILGILIIYVLDINVFGNTKPHFNIIFYLFLLRALSRSYEIAAAFLVDVLQEKPEKLSSLNGYERLKLALTSFVEIILNFSFVYYSVNLNYVESLKISMGNSLLVGVDDLNIICTVQVLTSMVLIYFALADYLGEKGIVDNEN